MRAVRRTGSIRKLAFGPSSRAPRCGAQGRRVSPDPFAGVAVSRWGGGEAAITGIAVTLRRVLRGNRYPRVFARRNLTLRRVLSPSCPRTLPGSILPPPVRSKNITLAKFGDVRENFVDHNIFWDGRQKSPLVRSQGLRVRGERKIKRANVLRFLSSTLAPRL
jgi:hypothetical protein